MPHRVNFFTGTSGSHDAHNGFRCAYAPLPISKIRMEKSYPFRRSRGSFLPFWGKDVNGKREGNGGLTENVGLRVKQVEKHDEYITSL